MSQALYRKWRPQNWQQIAGQQPVVETLRNALAAGKIAHAYLFSGPRGTGKTTTARLLAKAVNCLDPDPAQRPCGACEYCLAVNQGRFLDLIEIDAASNTSVDDVRDLREKINFSPNQGVYKVYIVDEVHMLSTAAFNALLKTLEEPPPHAIFVLATTEVHKIPATVLSRCQRHEFRRISVVEIIAYLKKIAKAEGITVEDEALSLIARQSTGAMRDAISLLDQLSSTGKVITLEVVQDVLGTAASQAVLDLIETLIAKDSAKGLECIHATLDSGCDPRQFARQVVDYLRDLLIMKMGDPRQIDATPEMRLLMGRHVQAFTPTELLRMLRIFNAANVEGRGSWLQPALPLEMAYIESLQSEPVTPANRQPSPASISKPGKGRATAEPAPAEPIPDSGKVEKVDRTPAAEIGKQPAEKLSQTDQQETQNLASQWDKVLNLVRRENPSTYGLMNSCKSRFIRGSQVLLGFPSDLLRDKMEKEENISLAKRILSQVFQREITVRCYADVQQRGTIPPELDDDGMVASAMRDLGGELVDMG
jgi:DNA polymerase-3 subunit gamma/tau